MSLEAISLTENRGEVLVNQMLLDYQKFTTYSSQDFPLEKCVQRRQKNISFEDVTDKVLFSASSISHFAFRSLGFTRAVTGNNRVPSKKRMLQ